MSVSKERKLELNRATYMKSKEQEQLRLLRQQRNCDHAKGGKHKNFTFGKDYNLMDHTFIDNKRVIKCLSCGMKWRPGDTKSTIQRNGLLYKNHTGIGWDEALVMLQSSSNSSTSSERPDTTKTPDPNAPAKIVLVRNPQVNPLPNEKPQPASRYTLWEKAQRIFGIETRREKRRRIIKEIKEKGLRGMYANISNMGEDVGIVYRSPANRGSYPNSAQSNEPSSYSNYADVWYNCPVELIEIFDMGKARDDRDHLEISHSISHKQSAFIKSIYVRAIQYIRDGDPFSQQHVTRSEMDDYASRYVDILKDAVSVADRSIGYKAVYGMLYFIAAKNGYKQEVESFIRSVQEGTNLENGTPAHLLHKRFYLNKQTRQAATRSPRHATLWAVLAFRRHILGEPLHNFNVREGFDLPDGTGGLLTSA